MSFREKCAWISLVSLLGIYGRYFWSVIRSGAWPDGARLARIVETVVALVVVQVAVTIAVALFSPKEADAPLDERERLIELRATRFAYGLLSGSVACACLFGGFSLPILFNTNALLLALVAAEMLRSGGQIIQYRRGV